MKRSKAYRQASEQIDRTKLYSPAEAVTLAKKAEAKPKQIKISVGSEKTLEAKAAKSAA